MTSVKPESYLSGSSSVSDSDVIKGVFINGQA